MSTLSGNSRATVYINGQPFPVDSWDISITRGMTDVSSMGSPYVTKIHGLQETTITLTGALPAAASLPEPREDIVTHLADHCCCRHCPEGGNHA